MGDIISDNRTDRLITRLSLGQADAREQQEALAAALQQLKEVKAQLWGKENLREFVEQTIAGVLDKRTATSWMKWIGGAIGAAATVVAGYFGMKN